MFVEIRKAGFVNKGAELMLMAAREAVLKEYPEAKLVIPPSKSATYENYAPLGFYPKAEYFRFRTQWGNFSFLLPKEICKCFGLVVNKEIDVVLDAAGFSYSDQWGFRSSREMAAATRKWRRQGTTVILLPQAFGSFNNPRNKESIEIIADNADMIYARESASYEYLTQVCGERKNIKQAPDFTCLIEGVLPSNYDSSDKGIAIVPNYRMIDKTSAKESKAYLPFLIKCANYLKEKGAKPFVLVHEGQPDYKLATEISENAGNIPIVKETNPLKIKGILGACQATIGSRFHGLVSALSQGVPSLATGWSHKYKMLFDDYNFAEGLLTFTEDFETIAPKLDLIANEEWCSEMSGKLEEKANVIKASSIEMWTEIFEIISKNPRARR